MSIINLVVSKQEKTRVKLSLFVLNDRTDNKLLKPRVSYLIVGLLCDVIQTPAYVLE